jgi:hypothetical protein
MVSLDITAISEFVTRAVVSSFNELSPLFTDFTNYSTPDVNGNMDYYDFGFSAGQIATVLFDF